MPTSDAQLRERIQRMCLIEDAFMRACFQEHPECAQAVLRIIMGIPNLQVHGVRTQREYANLRGREVCMDITATDTQGRLYDVDVQRRDEADLHLRAGYYLAMLRAHSLEKGRSYSALPEAYVIFITRGDYFKLGQPIYHFEQRMDGSGQPLGDRTHIIFVNGSVRDGSTPLAQLMHDFFCPDPGKMLIPELAHAVRDIKTTHKGAHAMSEVLEEVRAEGRAEGRKEGSLSERLQAALRMLADGLALEKTAQYSGLALDEVRALAAGAPLAAPAQ